MNLMMSKTEAVGITVMMMFGCLIAFLIMRDGELLVAAFVAWVEAGLLEREP